MDSNHTVVQFGYDQHVGRLCGSGVEVPVGRGVRAVNIAIKSFRFEFECFVDHVKFQIRMAPL